MELSSRTDYTTGPVTIGWEVGVKDFRHFVVFGMFDRIITEEGYLSIEDCGINWPEDLLELLLPVESQVVVNAPVGLWITFVGPWPFGRRRRELSKKQIHWRRNLFGRVAACFPSFERESLLKYLGLSVTIPEQEVVFSVHASGQQYSLAHILRIPIPFTTSSLKEVVKNRGRLVIIQSGHVFLIVSSQESKRVEEELSEYSRRKGLGITAGRELDWLPFYLPGV